MSAKPDQENYLFHIDRNGEKERRKVARADFDYFDFEDHYLYGADRAGQPRKFRVLNSFTLGIEIRTVECKGDEILKVKGKKYDCLKYVCITKDFTTTVWKEKKTNTIIKQTFPNGATIQLSNKNAANFFK